MAGFPTWRASNVESISISWHHHGGIQNKHHYVHLWGWGMKYMYIVNTKSGLFYTSITININVLKPKQNGHRFADCIFKYIFFNENCHFIDISSPGPNIQWISIGSSSGLVPNRWQAITWNNDGIVPTNTSITRLPWVILFYKHGLTLFNPRMDKWLHALLGVGWNYLSIPKLQRFYRWSLGMDK